MNKGKDFSLSESHENKTSRYPKLACQAGEPPKKTQRDHLSICMSQRNLPTMSTEEVKLIRDYPKQSN